MIDNYNLLLNYVELVDAQPQQAYTTKQGIGRAVTRLIHFGNSSSSGFKGISDVRLPTVEKVHLLQVTLS